MHWANYAIAAVVYLTGPLIILVGFLVFKTGEWVTLFAFAVVCVLVWLNDVYPPERRHG